MKIKGKLKKEVHDYVLMMLGAPCVKVELDSETINLCVLQAVKFLNDYGIKTTPQNIKEGTLSYATITLGRIRCMFIGDPNDPEGGPCLIEKGKRMVDEWKSNLIKEIKKYDRF